MLTVNGKAPEASAYTAHQNTTAKAKRVPNRTSIKPLPALRFEWLGQMAASLCWIASVLNYGISSSGDWLQLAAACCWLMANMASIVPQAEARTESRVLREKEA